jgi:hypothetical protein
MKNDRTNSLRSIKRNDLEALRVSWKAYNYGITHPKLSTTDPSDHRRTESLEPVTFEEYVSMRKERTRRLKISDTLSFKSEYKKLGLTNEQIDILIRRRKALRKV